MFILAHNSLCVYTLALFTTKSPFSLLPDTVKCKRSPTIPCSHSPPFFSLCRLLSAIYRRPSISPACQRAFSFGLLLQGARRWQITTRQPVIFNLSAPPPRPPSSSAGHTHFPRQHQFRHSNSPPPLPVPSHPPISSSFDQHRKFCSEAPRQKKRTKYCGNGSIQVREAASAVLLLRPLSLVMTQESGKYWSRVTQGIHQIALTKLVVAFNSKVSSLGWDPGEKSNCALFHGGF